MKKQHSIKIFFISMIIGFLISSIRIEYKPVPNDQIINIYFFVFLYNFIVGIFAGLAGLFGNEFYFYLKKNLRNENGLCRC